MQFLDPKGWCVEGLALCCPSSSYYAEILFTPSKRVNMLTQLLNILRWSCNRNYKLGLHKCCWFFSISGASVIWSHPLHSVLCVTWYYRVCILTRYAYLLQLSPPETLSQVWSDVSSSNSRWYFFTVLLVVLSVILAIGVCCGRVTKRVAAEIKNR